MKKWKTMGAYVLDQQHRRDALGAIARDLARLVSDEGANVDAMQRDELSTYVSEKLGLDGWNIIDDVYYDEWMDAAGYDARSGYVYIFRQSGVYKIGVTTDIRKRLSTIQMSTPNRVTIAHSFRVRGIYADVYEWEKALHRRFAKRKVRGEWFRLTNVDVAWLKRISDEFIEDLGTVDCTLPVPSDIDAALKEFSASGGHLKEIRNADWADLFGDEPPPTNLAKSA